MASRAILSIVLIGCVYPLSAFAHDAHQHHQQQSSENLDQSRPPAMSGESIYQLDSTWTDQNGKDTKLSSLRGHPVVAAMVYTSCEAACPLIISDLKRIQDGLADAVKSQVRFAVFSFDSDRDTPAKLKEFAKAHSLDTSRWTLFHSSPASVRKLAAVLGIRYKKDKKGDFDHSNVITLLDREGLISYQQVGLRQDPKESIARLTQIAGARTQ